MWVQQLVRHWGDPVRTRACLGPMGYSLHPNLPHPVTSSCPCPHVSHDATFSIILLSQLTWSTEACVAVKNSRLGVNPDSALP